MFQVAASLFQEFSNVLSHSLLLLIHVGMLGRESTEDFGCKLNKFQFENLLDRSVVN